MNNVITIERNKLFKSKFDACKGDLKITYKLVNQLLNKPHCSNFQGHTNNFEKSSWTPKFMTRKQLIKDPLEYFTEIKDDDIIKIVMKLANKLFGLDAIPGLLFNSFFMCAYQV